MHPLYIQVSFLGHQALKLVALLGWLQVPYLHYTEPHYNFCLFMPLVWLSVLAQSTPIHSPSMRSFAKVCTHPLPYIFSFIVVFFSFPNVYSLPFLDCFCELPHPCAYYVPGCSVHVGSNLKPVQIFCEHDLCRKGGRDSWLCFLDVLTSFHGGTGESSTEVCLKLSIKHLQTFLLQISKECFVVSFCWVFVSDKSRWKTFFSVDILRFS